MRLSILPKDDNRVNEGGDELEIRQQTQGGGEIGITSETKEQNPIIQVWSFLVLLGDSTV